MKLQFRHPRACAAALWGIWCCGAVLLLCAWSSMAFAAVSPAPRTLYVSAGFIGGDGLNADRPLGSINDALQKARKGDVVVVAPGEYQESIRVLTAGITVQGSVPGETDPKLLLLLRRGNPDRCCATAQTRCGGVLPFALRTGPP